jgi:hypothetical protein
MKKNNPRFRFSDAWRRAGAVIAALMALCMGCLHSGPAGNAQHVNRQPRLFPFAHGTVIPPNIAPLNFLIKEKGDRFCVTITGHGGPRITLVNNGPAVRIPPEKWRKLLASAKGGAIGLDIYCHSQNTWYRYDTVWDTVSVDNIDSHIAYRKIPVCKDWASMGMYQRDLRNFEEKVVFHNRKNDACFNCHSFRNNNPADMAFEVRSKVYGTPMVLAIDGAADKYPHGVNTKTAFSSGKAGFTSWHPDKDLIAFSMNRFEMLFYSCGIEPRAVFDGAGDIAVYDITNNTVTSAPELHQSNRIETMPEWSRDGRWLYYCSAPQLPEQQYKNIRCDLMRIAYDPELRTWGTMDTVITAEKAGGSVLQPRCSPDGRFILVTVADFSDFPIDKAGSRLCIFECGSGSLTKVGTDSHFTDAWHGWSHNGRWIVCNSKRINGRFSSLIFFHCDSNGVIHTPFVLPQKDPAFYESSLTAYNVPEFITSAIPYSIRQFQNAMDSYRSKATPDAATKATVRQGGQDEY